MPIGIVLKSQISLRSVISRISGKLLSNMTINLERRRTESAGYKILNNPLLSSRTVTISFYAL